jgi:plasmid maintenance system antidote protein VapI
MDLKDRIEKCGVKQSFLASYMGLDRSYFNLVVNGRKELKKWRKDRLIEVLDKLDEVWGS